MRAMVIDEDEREQPAFELALVDRVAVIALVAANVLPLLVWRFIDDWAQRALVLYSG